MTNYATRNRANDWPRTNLYRFNAERGCWQFYDGVGPWCNCDTPLKGKNEAEGDRCLRDQSFVPETEIAAA